MIKKFFILLLFICFSSSMFAQNNKQDFIKNNGNLLLNKINIYGLKKTSKDLILNEINISIGDTISNFNDEEFLSKIYKMGNFSKVNINYLKNPNNTVDININLSERHTLIPLPIFAKNGNKSTFGIFILDTNFLGLNRLLIIGGAISNNGNSGTLIYSSPKIFNSDFGFSIIGALTNKDIELSNLYKNNILLDYKMKTKTAGVSLAYNPIKDVLQVNLRSRYTKYNIEENEIKKNAKGFNNSLEIKLDLKNYDEYFSYGFDSNIEYGITNYKENSKRLELHNLDSNFSYTKPIFSSTDLMLKMNGAGSFKSNNTPLILQNTKGGMTPTLVSIVDTLPIKNNISSSIGLEKPVYYTNWGAITIKGFYELGLLTNTLDYYDYTRYSGIGIGTNLYLKKIKIPAVGFNITNNLRTNETNIIITAGVRF